MKNIKRIISYIADLIIINAFTQALFYIVPIQYFAQNESNIIKTLGFFVILVFSTMASVLYAVGMYRYVGNTFGKVLFGIKIVDEKNKKATIKEVFEREFTKWALFYSTLGVYGLYCAVSILFSKRLYHDIIAKTNIK
jgi:uncharacterized RDD family membrane protein YckC